MDSRIEFLPKQNEYCVLIPIINEGERIEQELRRAMKCNLSDIVDIIICDGDSTDGCADESKLRCRNVNTLLIKTGNVRQGIQLRQGIEFALERNYKGIVIVDGNNKDSIEDLPKFIQKLEEGYDFVQGSRFIKGGKEINTPMIRKWAIRLIHAPIMSKIARYHFTDSTNGYKAFSAGYLKDERVQPLRDIFVSYELQAYLTVRATQIGRKACEIPVTRQYPKYGKIPTKISPIKGNLELLKILYNNMRGKYNP